MSETIKRYTIHRDGQKGLRFRGSVLAKASNHSYQGSRQNRWNEITLYELEGEKGFVLHTLYRTCWQGESDSSQAYHCTTPEQVFARLYDDSQEATEMGCQLSDLARELLVEAGDPFESLTYEEL
jgi:hypothetical protein